VEVIELKIESEPFVAVPARLYKAPAPPPPTVTA
jgi:hypothetical protein